MEVLEIILSPDRKNNSGTLLLACKSRINKEKQLELELLQNPWKLVDVIVRQAKLNGFARVLVLAKFSLAASEAQRGCEKARFFASHAKRD